MEQACQHLTTDDVAKRVGIAKDSPYLHTNTRVRLVAEALGGIYSAKNAEFLS